MHNNLRITSKSYNYSNSLCCSLYRSNSNISSEILYQNSFTSYENTAMKDLLIIGITCINCQAIISESEIEVHSLHCTTLSNSLILAEQSPLNELHFKLQKLYSFFVMLLSCKLKNSEREAVDLLKRTVSMLIHMKEESHVKYIQEIEQSVTLITKDLEDSLDFHIYTQRVISLARALSTSIQLEVKKKQIESIKIQIDKYRNKASTLQQVLMKGSRSQSVDVVRSRYSTDSLNSSSNEFKSMNSDQVMNLYEKSSNEDMKRYFFSLALAAKLNYHQNHPIHRVDLHKVYQSILALK